jgi:DNA-binding GntR family transcriptional regulator
MAAEATGAGEDTIELDRRFHDLLMAPAEMPYLRDLVEQARRRSDAFRRAHTYVIPGLSTSSNREHAGIVAAAEAGDAALATELIQRHLRNAADHLITYFVGRFDGKAGSACPDG